MSIEQNIENILTISTHILDTSKGLPAPNVPVTLSVFIDDIWHTLAHATTNSDGRVKDWLSDTALKLNPLGLYQLNFKVQTYFASQKIIAFFPEVNLQFKSDGVLKHLHVPLLLNPYGYSTYRGS